MPARDDGSSRLTNLVFPGVVAIGILLIGFLTYQPELKSQRPRTHVDGDFHRPVPSRGINATRARMWQDPLTVYDDEAPISVPKSEAKLSIDISASLPDKTLSYGATLLSSAANPASDLGDNSSIGNVKKNIEARREKAKGLKCLFVLIPGGPDSDAREQRMRMRYAVVSALGRTHYSMSYPTRLSYFDFVVDIHTARHSLHLDTVKTTLRIPFKLYASPSGAAQELVFVFWIDEDRLGAAPLHVISKIFRELFSPCCNRQPFSLAVLGPSSSDTLKKMYHELSDDCRCRMFGVHEVTLFSCRATVTALQLTDVNNDVNNEDNEGTRAKQLKCLFRKRGIDLHRTIGTDKQLVDALQYELKIRRAWPTEGSLGREGRIVLLTERDTLYGRAYERLFKNGRGLDGESLIVRKYLRGLDGEIPGASFDEREHRSHDAERREARYLGERPYEPRIGQSQVDYLRRIANELRRVHAEDVRNGTRGIVAVGVIGSDVYDKLLILRALRKSFPCAWFFTTDLDDELFRPTELPWTKNLIIASHYGLAAGKDVQCDVPPFRDSYQTALFLGCLAFLESSDQCDSAGKSFDSAWKLAELKPLVFEAGRYEPFQLTLNPGPIRQKGCDADKAAGGGNKAILSTVSASSVHPQSVREDWTRDLGWCLFIAFSVLAFAATLYLCDVKAVYRAVHLLGMSWVAASIWAWYISSPFLSSIERTKVVAWLRGRVRTIRIRTSPYLSWIKQTRVVAWLSERLPTKRTHFERCVLLLPWPFHLCGAMVIAQLFVASSNLPRGSWLMLVLVLVLAMLGTAIGGCLGGYSSRTSGHQEDFWEQRLLIRRFIQGLWGTECRAAERRKQNEKAVRWAKQLSLLIAPQVLVVIVLAAVIVDHYRANGEPFSLWEGISIWPSVLCWLTVLVAGSVMLFFATEDVRRNCATLRKTYINWEQSRWKDQVWQGFFRERELISRYHNALPIVCVFFFGAYFFFQSTEVPPMPARGDVSRVFSLGILFASVLITFAVTFVVVHVFRHSGLQLKTLIGGDEGPAFPTPAEPTPNCERAQGALTVLEIVADRTNVIGKLLTYPAILILLLFLARSSWFDRMGPSTPLLVIYLTLLLLPISYYYSLRRAAWQLRTRYLSCLRDDEAALDPSEQDGKLKRLDFYQKRIADLNRGAFRPIGTDPLFKALAIPFGGSGGLLLVEQLLRNWS